MIEVIPSTGDQVPLETEMLEAYLWNLTPKEKEWVHEAILLQMKSAEIQQKFGISRHSVYVLKKMLLIKCG
jgi:DNA-directed RNA polymerase